MHHLLYVSLLARAGRRLCIMAFGLRAQVAEGRGGGQAGSSVVFMWGGGPGSSRHRQVLPGGVSQVAFLRTTTSKPRDLYRILVVLSLYTYMPVLWKLPSCCTCLQGP